MIQIKPDKLQGLVPRMLELTSRSTPWHRRDWRAGTLELVDEALTETLVPGTSELAQKELLNHMRQALGSDAGITSSQKDLGNIIRGISPAHGSGSHNVFLAKYYAGDIRETYLKNWADIFDSSSKAGNLDIEGTAKRIVSHLLYCGMPAPSAYKIIHQHKVSTNVIKFSALLRELDQKLKDTAKYYSFAVPVDRAPSFLHSTGRPGRWMTPKQLKSWKRTYAPTAEQIRHHGGFILTVRGRDVNEAANEARSSLSQLSFKFRSGSDNQFSILRIMWSKENGNAFPTRRRAQPLKLRAFQRANSLHCLDIGPRTRNILAIIEPLQTHDPHVAIVNGWVAIESLLVDTEESDRIGAERMARVVAASYFRTEMTWLASNYARAYQHSCPIASQISKTEKSIERARLMAEAIVQGKSFDDLNHTDQLAVEKMRTALRRPGETFDRTFQILKREFQRMYRKRNLVVHSGQAIEKGIESLADKAIPLLVNGIDQLLIASIQHDYDPKELAASIEFKARHLYDTGNSRTFSILDLLEIE